MRIKYNIIERDGSILDYRYKSVSETEDHNINQVVNSFKILDKLFCPKIFKYLTLEEVIFIKIYD